MEKLKLYRLFTVPNWNAYLFFWKSKDGTLWLNTLCIEPDFIGCPLVLKVSQNPVSKQILDFEQTSSILISSIKYCKKGGSKTIQRFEKFVEKEYANDPIYGFSCVA